MDVACVKHQVLINIEEYGIRISRCCRFFQSAASENCQFILFRDFPKDDNELKELIISKAKEVPEKFRDLKYGEEKRCKVNCFEVYNAEPTSITISMPGCNLHCTICGLGNQHASAEMRDAYRRLLLTFGSDDRFMVAPTVTGEPFLYKRDTFKFLEKTNRPTWITSNMTLLTDEDVTFLSKFKGKLVILASIDSINEDVYKSIRQGTTSAMFERAIRNTELLAQAGVVTAINCTITDQNLDFDLIEDVIQWASRIGVKMNLAPDSNKPELFNHPVIQKINELHKGEDIWRI